MAADGSISDELRQLKRAELLGLADEAHLPGRTRMRKDELRRKLAKVPGIRQLLARISLRAAPPSGKTPSPLRVGMRGKTITDRGKVKQTQRARSSGTAVATTPREAKRPGAALEGAARRRARAVGVPVNEARAVLMVVDPHWAYAYWKTESRVVEQGRQWLGDSEARVALRFHDLERPAAGDAAAASFDIAVEGAQGEYYLNLWDSGKRLAAELGLLSGDGRFVAITRSNEIELPRAEEAESYENELQAVHRNVSSLWRPRRQPQVDGESSLTTVAEEVEPAELAAAAASADPEDGATIAEPAVEAPATAPVDVRGPLVVPEDWSTGIGTSSGELSSGVFSSRTTFDAGGRTEVTIQAEVLLRGQAAPGAQLSIEGVAVPLAPDGSFVVRFAFPPAPDDAAEPRGGDSSGPANQESRQ